MAKEILTQKNAKQSPVGGVVVGKRKGQTMIYDDASVGGYFVGKTHSEGGIQMINKSTGQPLEVQGSEVIITAPAVADQTKREFEGKMLTNREILSEINSRGGGVSFAEGGDIPKSLKYTGATYKYGGRTMSDHDIYNHINKGHLAKGKTLKQIAKLHGTTLLDINKQVVMGLKAESEHTSSKREQLKIVKDHLAENPEYYTLLKKAGLENGGRFDDGGYVSYKDKYNRKYNYKKNTSHTLKDISKDTGVSIVGLQKIYNKGIGAYKTNPSSVRPTVKSKEQWAMARVYSAVMGGKASNVDSNELKMNYGGSIKKEDLAKDSDKGNTPARDLNNYNDLLDVEADGAVGGDNGLTMAKGGDLSEIDTYFDLGGNVGMPEVEYIKIGQVSNSIYSNLSQKQFSSYIDLVESLKDIFIQNGKKAGYFYFTINDTKTTFAIQFKDGKNTVLNFNPITGNYKDFEKQIERRTLRTSKLFNWGDWFRGKKSMPSTQTQSSTDKFTQEEVDMFEKMLKYMSTYGLVFNSDGLENTLNTTAAEFILLDNATGSHKLYTFLRNNFEFSYEKLDLRNRLMFEKFLNWFDNKKLGNPSAISQPASSKLVEIPDSITLKGSSIRIDELPRPILALALIRGIDQDILPSDFTNSEYLRVVQNSDKNKIFVFSSTEEGFNFWSTIDNGDFTEFKEKYGKYGEKVKDIGAFKTQAQPSSSNNKPIDLKMTKIWIGDNPELSKRVQERAFELGYDWFGGGKKIQFTNGKGLLFNDKNEITYSDSKDFFNGYANKEIFADDLFYNAIGQTNTQPSTATTTPINKDIADNIAEDNEITYIVFSDSQSGINDRFFLLESLYEQTYQVRNLTNGRTLDDFISFHFENKFGKPISEEKSIFHGSNAAGLFVNEYTKKEDFFLDIFEIFPELNFMETLSIYENIRLYEDFKSKQNALAKPVSTSSSTQQQSNLLTDLSNTKIWIGSNPELSKRVQERAFELGWDWSSLGKITKYEDYSALFFGDNNKISYANDRNYFDNDKDYKEIFADQLFSSATASQPTQSSQTNAPTKAQPKIENEFVADDDELRKNDVLYSKGLEQERFDLDALAKLLPSFQQSKFAVEKASIVKEMFRIQKKIAYKGFIASNEEVSKGADLFTPQGLLHYYFTQTTQNPTAELQPACELPTPNGAKSKLPLGAYLNVRSSQFKKWFGDWEKAYETDNYNNCSKMIDEETKEPKIFYHGVRKYIPSFGQMSNMGSGVVRPYGSFEPPNFPASYFADNESYANFYGGIAENMPKPSPDYKPFIYKVFLSIKNPISLLPLDFEISYRDLIDYVLVAYGVRLSVNNVLLGQLENDMDKKHPMWVYIRRDIGLIETLKDYGYDALIQQGDIPTFDASGEVVSDRSKFIKDTEYLSFYPDQVKSATVKKSFYFNFFNDIRFKKGGYVRI
jgi:hypothetical protein